MKTKTSHWKIVFYCFGIMLRIYAYDMSLCSKAIPSDVTA